MTSHTRTVKACYEAFECGDIPALTEMLAPDVEWEHDWGGQPLKYYRPRRGHDGVAGFFETLDDFDFIKFEPFAFLEGDGMVVSLAHIELTVRSNGKTFRDLEGHLWTFAPDGRVARFRHLTDTHQLALVTN
jgi:uncharacterized protein